MKTIAQPWGHRAAFLTIVLVMCAGARISAGQENIPVPPIAAGQNTGLQPIAAAPIFYPPPGQGLGPAAPCPICAVDGSCCRVCGPHGYDRQPCWEDARFIAWQAYAQGEYVGHARTAHVPEYRLRVDDQLDMLYRITRDETRSAYRLNVGDSVRVESFTDPDLNRELMVQPDGMITVRLLGQVHAAGSTVTQLRNALEDHYKKYYKVPSITVTPIKVNAQLDDLRNVVDRRYGPGGGQGSFVRVAPDGTISLTAIGYVRARLDTGRTAAGDQRALPREDRGHGDHPRPLCARRDIAMCWARSKLRDVSRWWARRPPCRPSPWPEAGTWERTSCKPSSSAAATIGGSWPRGSTSKGPCMAASRPFGRDLALRRRRDRRPQGPHPGDRRLYQPALYPRAVRRLSGRSGDQLRQAVNDLIACADARLFSQ